MEKHKENVPVIRRKKEKEIKTWLHAIKISTPKNTLILCDLEYKQHTIEVKTQNIFHEHFGLFF